MSKVQMLKALVKQRLTVDAGEIFELFERRITEYEEELCRSKQHSERQQKLLDAVLNPEVLLNTADVQLLTVTKEDGPPEQQEWSLSLDQEDPGPPHIKEEHEEIWISQEGEQLQGLILSALVKQRLLLAAEEIFGLFERVIAEYKEELCRSKKENEQQQKLLDAVFKPKVLLHRAGCPVDVRVLSVNNKHILPEQQEWRPILDQEDPEPRHIKEEQEELWIKQEKEHLQGLEEADITKFPSAPVPVKSEEDEEKPQYSQLHQRQTEENRDETDGEEHCGGSEPAWSLDPDEHLQTDTDDKTEHSSDTEDSDEDDAQSREPESDFCHHIIRRTGEKPFSCSVCQKLFRHRNNVKRHMNTHTGKKPFSCSVCGTKFARKSHLHDHHMARHTGVKPFKCSVCEKQFGCANNFKKHIKRHTREKPLTSRVSDTRCQTKRHNCSECGKTFGSVSILKRHMKVHTGEKPFGCSVCGKRFARKAHLVNHTTQHTGEKPYSCSVCQKTFARKDCVKLHMKIHTREEKEERILC